MFNKWLVEKLNEMEWKQADLAKRSGITKGSISNYINGRTPNKSSLIKISKAFKMPPERIFQIAGILPEDTPTESLIKEAIHLLEKLNDEEKKDVMKYIQMRLKIQEERKKIKTNENRKSIR